MNAKRLLVLSAAVPALFALVHCGGGGSNSGGGPSSPGPAPTPAPTAAPPVALVCDPTPPPLYGFRMKIHQNSGRRKTLDATPLVVNTSDDYCGQVGLDGNFCFTRPEGDPQREDCDRMAMGMAGDTGRYGPTWFFNGGTLPRRPHVRRGRVQQPPRQPVPGHRQGHRTGRGLRVRRRSRGRGQVRGVQRHPQRPEHRRLPIGDFGTTTPGGSGPRVSCLRVSARSSRRQHGEAAAPG